MHTDDDDVATEWLRSRDSRAKNRNIPVRKNTLLTDNIR